MIPTEKKDVMISYKRGDEETGTPPEGQQIIQLAREMFRRLEISSWIDTEDIPVGTDWDKRIKEQLSMCSAVFVIVGPEFVESDYCEQEALISAQKGKAVIVGIKGGMLSGLLANQQAAFLDDWDGSAYQNLFNPVLKSLEGLLARSDLAELDEHLDSDSEDKGAQIEKWCREHHDDPFSRVRLATIFQVKCEDRIREYNSALEELDREGSRIIVRKQAEIRGNLDEAERLKKIKKENLSWKTLDMLNELRGADLEAVQTPAEAQESERLLEYNKDLIAEVKTKSEQISDLKMEVNKLTSSESSAQSELDKRVDETHKLRGEILELKQKLKDAKDEVFRKKERREEKILAALEDHFIYAQEVEKACSFRSQARQKAQEASSIKSYLEQVITQPEDILREEVSPSARIVVAPHPEYPGRNVAYIEANQGGGNIVKYWCEVDDQDRAMGLAIIERKGVTYSGEVKTIGAQGGRQKILQDGMGVMEPYARGANFTEWSGYWQNNAPQQGVLVSTMESGGVEQFFGKATREGGNILKSGIGVLDSKTELILSRWSIGRQVQEPNRVSLSRY